MTSKVLSPSSLCAVVDSPRQGGVGVIYETVKQEEVYRNEYLDFQEVHNSIGKFLERVYNQKRLHSALGYRSPSEFENGAAS